MKWLLSIALVTGISLSAEEDKEPRKSLVIGKKVTKDRRGLTPKKNADNTNRELGSGSKTKSTRKGLTSSSRPDKAFREEFLDIMLEVTGSDKAYKKAYKKNSNIIKSRFDLTWDLLVAEITNEDTKERYKKEIAKAASKSARYKGKNTKAKKKSTTEGLSTYRYKYYTKKFAVQEKDIASKSAAIDKLDIEILANSK